VKGKTVGRLGCTLEDNIKIYLTEIMLDGANCCHLAQDMDCWRNLVNTVLNFRVHRRNFLLAYTYSRGSQTVGPLHPGAPLVLLGGQVDCMRNIFILNEIWMQGKKYILIGPLLG
jgi:hypothetical protein